MVCELGDDTAWPALLEARSLLASGVGELSFVQRGSGWNCIPTATADLRAAGQALTFGAGSRPRWDPADGPADGAWTVHSTTTGGQSAFGHPTGRPVADSMQSMARVYLPVLLGARQARAAGRVFVAGHVTQTLDGRIACHNGQSQWIGNAADLRHAHRMRALLDGVMIGAGTTLTDNPRLNVRHVAGPDPRRIVLSGSGRVLRHAGSLHVFRPPGCDVVIGSDAVVAAPGAPTDLVRVPARDGGLDPRAVLVALRARGIHSIYLEGGSATLSSFLAAGCIDLLQVHVAGLVLGSGLPSFTLPPVDHVRHGLAFAMDHAMLDGHVLLSCWPQAGGPG